MLKPAHHGWKHFYSQKNEEKEGKIAVIQRTTQTTYILIFGVPQDFTLR